MKNVLTVFNTVRHLKFIQVWNRITRKFLPRSRSPNPQPKTRNPILETLPVFSFLNQTASPKGWNDKTLPKLWLYNLHYFDWLNAEGGCEEAKSLPLIERWIEENPVGWGNGWEPYPISLRVVNWIKWLESKPETRNPKPETRNPKPSTRNPKLETRNPKPETSLISQIEWLVPRLEYHLLGNHLLANAKALVFAGKWFGRDDWYKKGMKIYRKELPEQVLDDGVHFELSPMYHCIMLEDVLDCWEYTKESIFEAYAAKMVGALDLICGPDGRISLFNDSAYGIAKEPYVLSGRFAALGGKVVEPGSIGRLSGFVKLQKGDWTLVAKCGVIGPSYQPGHAHADTGSFELWKSNDKLISDTGTDRYVVDDKRKRQRGSAAHNVVVIDGENSSEVWAGHRVARRAKPLGWKVNDSRSEVELEYLDCRRFKIRRHLKLTDDGLVATDEIFGRGTHDIELRFHSLPHSPCHTSVEGEQLSSSPCSLCLEFGKQIDGEVVSFKKNVSLPYTIEWRIG